MRAGGPLEGGLRLAAALTFDVTDSELPYDVTMTVGAFEGRLVCQRLELAQRRNGPPVTTEGQRLVTVDAYLDAARAAAIKSGGVAFLAPVAGVPGAFEPATPEQWDAFDRAQRPRRPIDDVLPRVAAEYRKALRSPDPTIAKAPTEAVARALHYSRGHASRLVTAARKAGLLDPSRGRGRPGEVPTTKTARRPRKKGT